MHSGTDSLTWNPHSHKLLAQGVVHGCCHQHTSLVNTYHPTFSGPSSLQQGHLAAHSPNDGAWGRWARLHSAWLRHVVLLCRSSVLVGKLGWRQRQVMLGTHNHARHVFSRAAIDLEGMINLGYVHKIMNVAMSLCTNHCQTEAKHSN